MAKLNVMNSQLWHYEHANACKRESDIHRSESSEGSTNGDTSKAHFSNRRVDDSLLAKLVQQTLGDLESER